MYFGGFDNADDVMKAFEISSLDGHAIVLAAYESPDYEGDAFVLTMKNGELYVIEGNHCSCYGLEGQWQPELISVAYLQNRLSNGHFDALDGDGLAYLKATVNSLEGTVN